MCCAGNFIDNIHLYFMKMTYYDCEFSGTYNAATQVNICPSSTFTIHLLDILKVTTKITKCNRQVSYVVKCQIQAFIFNIMSKFI